MQERHDGLCEFERRFPQGLLCDINDVPEGFGSVYLITNVVNDKVYVGQTRNSVWKRWKGHLRDTRTRKGVHFHNAIEKYGADSFSLGLLGGAETQEDLDALEQLWVVLLQSANPAYGYNRTWGGQKTKRNSAEVIEKQSSRMIEAWDDPEFRAKMIEARSTVYDDPEYRRSLSDAAKEFWNSPEGREKRSAITTEIWENPEYRANMVIMITSAESRQRQSEILKNHWKSPEYRQRILAASSTPEARENHAEGCRRSWDEKRDKIAATKGTPEYKDKMKALHSSPEYRAKLTAGQKRAEQKPGRREQRSAAAKKSWETRRQNQ